jgi:hypothetical protein
MANFKLKDTAGKAHELYKMTDAKAIVISMHTRGCPIGQQLNPDFHALQAKYEAKGVKFMMINPNMHDTPEMIAKEAKEFDITMPILKDRSVGGEPWALSATETLITSRTWKILYQGPINDRVTLAAPADVHYASAVLDAMLAGGPWSRLRGAGRYLTSTSGRRTAIADTTGVVPIHSGAAIRRSPRRTGAGPPGDIVPRCPPSAVTMACAAGWWLADQHAHVSTSSTPAHMVSIV